MFDGTMPAEAGVRRASSRWSTVGSLHARRKNSWKRSPAAIRPVSGGALPRDRGRCPPGAWGRRRAPALCGADTATTPAGVSGSPAGAAFRHAPGPPGAATLTTPQRIRLRQWLRLRAKLGCAHVGCRRYSFGQGGDPLGLGTRRVAVNASRTMGLRDGCLRSGDRGHFDVRTELEPREPHPGC